MLLDSIRIRNFRCLKDIELNLSSFVCIIGENNSGKSSILLALNSFIENSKILKRDFYDSSKPIKIEIVLTGITDKDLGNIGESHRERIKELIIDGNLDLIKIFKINDKPKIFTTKLMPKDERFKKERIDEVLSGKRGTAIAESMENHFPEYKEFFEEVTTQQKAKDQVDEIIKSLAPEELEKIEIPLPTEMPATVKLLLPTPILIEAVKDLNDDIKTKDSSTFGKLIAVLLGAIQDTEEFKKINESLDELNGLLNRIDTGNGVVDERIPELKNIEDLVNQYLKENFQNANLQIGVPKPELKKVFSGAEICIDDGAKGLIESKGDGIKRAVTFALLRSYVEIRKQNSNNPNSEDFKYLILFEEPELYMHPAAQKILFEALCNLAEVNQVFVTTHSPIFFSPEYTGTFLKMKKKFETEGKPCSKPWPVAIKDGMDNRDLFKMLCYDNNNAAFFSNKIVLVEGDSDQIFFNHVTKKLKNSWDFDLNNIPIIQLAGKGSLKRYKDFFREFDIEIHTILDLDVIINGFEKIDSNERIKRLRDKLLEEIDEIIDNEEVIGDLSSNQIRDLVNSMSWGQQWKRFKELSKRIGFLTRLEQEEIALLFSKETENMRKTVLKDYELRYKDELLSSLREQNVYVLSLGSVESYYPDAATGRDKLSKAFNACELLSDKEKIIRECPLIRKEDNSEVPEFELIFNQIFD
jgi:putative ATP-dependent endonuclease of OLD family